MQVDRDVVVSLQYELFNADGKLIEKSSEPMEYIQGGYHGVFPRIEEALQGKSIGDTVDVHLEPADAFGEYDADLVFIEPRNKFPQDVAIGMMFQGAAEGSEQGQVFRVTDIADDKVVMDGNHPLAGKALLFKCKVSGLREATEEEIEHGHVHGEHGHHHH